MEQLLAEAKRIRESARNSPYWTLNIEALLESNNELFEGPITYEHMEQCFNYILDQYDPHILIKEGHLPETDYKAYLESFTDGNPFFSLIELDEEKKIADVVLWETDDCEMVGEFLSKLYKWKDR